MNTSQIMKNIKKKKKKKKKKNKQNRIRREMIYEYWRRKNSDELCLGWNENQLKGDGMERTGKSEQRDGVQWMLLIQKRKTEPPSSFFIPKENPNPNERKWKWNFFDCFWDLSL